MLCLLLFWRIKWIDLKRILHIDKIHDYESEACVAGERYSAIENIPKFTPSGKSIYVGGHAYSGEPVIVSQYKGICFTGDGADGWGYSSDGDPDEYAKHVASITAELIKSPYVQEYCYTQLCDIETEQNGLLTYDRTLKVPLELIRKANQ